MNINQKAQELAKLIKTTDEFQTMNKYKREIEKNKNIKRQLDNYLSKKDKIYTRYKIDEANKRKWKTCRADGFEFEKIKRSVEEFLEKGEINE